MRSPRLPGPPRSLAGRLFAVQVAVVAVVVALCAVFAWVNDRIQAEEAARNRADAAAKAVARSPSVTEAIRGSDPSRTLQPYAEDVRRGTGVAFVTIMAPDGTRFTHPHRDRIGEQFAGHTEEARRGHTLTETFTGTLGPSVRVVTPVRDDGRVVGLVSAGITVDEISGELRQQVALLCAAAGAALLLGGLGTWAATARLRRHTHGMNAAGLARMHAYHQATLHAVREGLLMLDAGRRVALVNDGARELLGLDGEEPDALVGRPVEELGLPPALTGALLDDEPRLDEVHLTADRVVVVSISPVSGGERRGTVVTLRDHTELQALAGELDSQRGLTEALRSQAHEASNRLHTVVSLIETGRVEEAVDFATEELELAQALTDQVVSAVEEPVLAALLLGKTAQAHERGVELVLTPDTRVPGGLPSGPASRELVTVLGNLVDNALEAVAEQPVQHTRPRVTVTVRTEETDEGPALLVRVTDTGPGVPPDEAGAVFRRGWSTKKGRPEGRGLGLALVRQTALRHGGTASVDRAEDGGAAFTVRIPLGAGAAV